MTESRFRERRSAHRDEPGAEPAATAAEPSAPAAETSAPAAESRPPANSVESSRSAAKQAAESSPIEEPAQAASPVVEPAETAAELDRLADMEVPEPSFLELVEPHIEMALRFLGELPLTPEGERRVLPRWAKREIDLLGILEQRTRGNLPPPEQEYLQQALDHLRTMYLKVSP
ncbi:MAG TPA: DUF1844 domain-containing protein [Gemmatimonadota bacterium]|nr:DUF1844 domain-containing protein [Gemmatimonadota bacterium]